MRKSLRPILDYIGRIDTKDIIEFMDTRFLNLLPKGASTSLSPQLADLSSKAESLLSSGSLSKVLSSSGAGLGLASGIYGLADTFFGSSNSPMPAGLTSQEKQQVSSQRQANASRTAKGATSGIMSILGSILALATL